jgi:hypothetical protein
MFIRLLDGPVEQKSGVLREVIGALRRADDKGAVPSQAFERVPGVFSDVPGSPFAYWVSEHVRGVFQHVARFEAEGRSVKQGLVTADDFRFVRAWWEVGVSAERGRWFGFAKGGVFSPFYADLPLLVGYSEGDQVGLQAIGRYGRGATHYFRPGLTWPLRTNGLSFRVMPSGCIFSHKGPAAFVEQDSSERLLALLAVMNSSPFGYLVSVQLARTELAQSYEVGLIQQTPLPALSVADNERLASLARRAWSLKRTLDTTSEPSHAFFLPPPLRGRIGVIDQPAIEAELADIQRQNDDLTFEFFGIAGEDRSQIEDWSRKSSPALNIDVQPATTDEDDDDSTTDTNDALDLVSWSVGVAFGRFDIRLATCDRAAPPEPEPFDPLPVHSPGMLPEGDPPFRQGTGIQVDDPGHHDDLTAVVTSVLNAVKVEPPSDLRHTLARDFFPFHIQRYSKSRRKAPIYWQLATPSASYSVWLYLHAFNADTLYKVQNDYVAPKLGHEEQKLDRLRREYGDSPTASQRKELDSQETFVAELRTFLDEVKRAAPLWKPDLDDGVIINFASLWRLVPHQRPWQKECKATWDALADGEYDWSHLAMHLWPERVVPKCQQDRSLAIAHGLEDIFWSEDADSKWKPRPTPTRPLNDLIKERTSSAVKAALDSLLSAPQPGGTSRPRGKGKRAATGGES